MDLLESDFPFIVTLLPVHGHHGIEGSPIAETQLLRILNGLLQVLVPVYQQISGHLLWGGTEVKGNHVGLCIPVGASPVLLPCESLGSDVQSFIFAGIGLVQLENIEADALLGCSIPLNNDIRMGPFLLPNCNVLSEKGIKPSYSCLLQNLFPLLYHLLLVVVQAAQYRYIFAKRPLPPLLPAPLKPGWIHNRSSRSLPVPVQVSFHPGIKHRPWSCR